MNPSPSLTAIRGEKIPVSENFHIAMALIGLVSGLLTPIVGVVVIYYTMRIRQLQAELARSAGVRERASVDAAVELKRVNGSVARKLDVLDSKVTTVAALLKPLDPIPEPPALSGTPDNPAPTRFQRKPGDSER